MLIEILSEEDAVSAADLERAAERQREQGGSLAEWLLRIGVLAEDDLFFLLSRRLGVPPIPEERLRHLTLAPELRRRVPRGFAEQWVVLPLDVDIQAASLSVAMLDPSDESTLEALRLRARVSRVRTYLARRSVILAAISRAYDAADDELDHTDPPLISAHGDVFGGVAELAPTFARGDGSAPADLAPGDTQVAMIPGKVEIDPMLAQEIAALDSDEQDDRSELFATRIKKVPSNELAGPRRPQRGPQRAPQHPPQHGAQHPPQHGQQQPSASPAQHGGARRPAGMPPVPPPARLDSGEERQLHGRSLLSTGGLDDSLTAALPRVPSSASPPPLPPETPPPQPARAGVSNAVAAAAAAAAEERRASWHQTQKFSVDNTEELELDEDEVAAALDRGRPPLDPRTDLTPRVERQDISTLFDAPVASVNDEAGGSSDDETTGEHALVDASASRDKAGAPSARDELLWGAKSAKARMAHAPTAPALPAGEPAERSPHAPAEPLAGSTDAARTLLNMPAADVPDARDTSPLDGGTSETDSPEAIMHDLFAAVGVLSSMLEERIDPGGALSREYARIARLVAREVGMSDLEIARVALAAHLCGLDVALRSELGAPGAARIADVASIFAAKPSTPGGLNPTLRSVGARALGLDASASPDEDDDPQQLPFAAQLVSTVSDYIELRAEAEEQGGDMDTVLQLMRASGADPELLDVLSRAVETEHEATQTSRTPTVRRS